MVDETCKQIQILIVGDRPRTRQSLKALLNTWPGTAAMYEAACGREALQVAKQNRPDVVVVDVEIPGTEGLKTTLQLKVCWPQVKVIVLSMHSDFRNDALAVGADAFVLKGGMPNRLLATLSALTSNGHGPGADS